MTQDPKPAVSGYTPLNSEQVALTNRFKELEEAVLRIIDATRGTDMEQRWISIAQTHFQEGFSALVRANFKPARLNGAIDPKLALEQAMELLEGRKPKIEKADISAVTIQNIFAGKTSISDGSEQLRKMIKDELDRQLRDMKGLV